MRPSNSQQRLSAEKTTRFPSNNGVSAPAGPSAGRHYAEKTQAKQDRGERPVEVRIRKTAPPDPELLSKIGCRCLVIDLPGVLYEHLAVSYVRGHVRVEGKRTVGRVKSFRRKFPLNHEQVMTRMLSAFLCQGVLLIVAPTKVAACMAAATIVATRLIMRGHNPLKTPTRKKKLLLMSGPATISEGPVKFSNDFRTTTATSDGKVIDCRQKSAFEPYVPTKSVPFDEFLDPNQKLTNSQDKTPSTNDSIPSTTETPIELLEDASAIDVHRMDTPTRANKGEAEQTFSSRSYCHKDERVTSDHLLRSSDGSFDVPSRHQQNTKKQTIHRGEGQGTWPFNEREKHAIWSDDSLRGEPSVRATKSLRIMEDFYIDSLREERMLDAPQLSPILEHAFPYEEDAYVEPSYDDGQPNGRPLTWVQFETGWQDKEESLMVDSFENHSRVARLRDDGRRKVPGTTATIGVPIMLPFEDELLDRDHNGFRMTLEPHPSWRSAPFLPRSTPLTFSSHLNATDQGSDNHATRSTMGDNSREHRIPPSPSLRRKTSSPTVAGPRKSVSWVDEI